MGAKLKSPNFVERVGRSFWFRAVVYSLPILYVVRLILMIVTPRAYHMPDWRMDLWQAARDASVVVNLFFWQQYCANYTVRRNSLTDRRRDAWKMPLFSCLYFSLELPSLLELPWSLVALTSLFVGTGLYTWEMHTIKAMKAGEAL